MIALYMDTCLGAYYYVNPFNEQTAWLDDVQTDLFPFVDNPEDQLVFVLVEYPDRSDPVAPLERCLQNKYITVNTNAKHKMLVGGSVEVGPGEFPVHLFPAVPVGSKIVNFRLHTAVVSKTQHTVDSHNNRIDIEAGGRLYELEISPSGNYSACDIARKVQDLIRAQVSELQDFEVTLDPVTATLRISSRTSAFRFRVPLDARKRAVCQSPLGLRGTDTGSAYYQSGEKGFCYFASAPGSDGSHSLVTGHVDVSGARMLRYSLRQYGGGDLEVGHVPLHDEPTTGVVCYSSQHTGTREWGWETPLEFSPVVVCAATDSLGRPYNFHGVACTYVFEVTIF